MLRLEVKNLMNKALSCESSAALKLFYETSLELLAQPYHLVYYLTSARLKKPCKKTGRANPTSPPHLRQGLGWGLNDLLNNVGKGPADLVPHYRRT